MEDALISPESFAILSGAGLLDVNKDAPIYVHTTSRVEVKDRNTIVLPQEACWNKYNREDEFYKEAADIFVMTTTDGQIDAEPCIPYAIADDHKTLTCYSHAGTIDVGEIVLVDYYVKKTGGAQLIEITADKFGGNYYLEASTLFRDEQSGVDMPAEFIIPNCKVQSNFTFTMAASGDPSTFTFTMDAFPDYVKFDKTHKVLASLQVITEAVDTKEDKREACVLFSADAMGGATMTYDNDGSEALIKITAEGAGVIGRTPDESYELAVFGDLSEKGDFVQATVHFNALSDDKLYTVTQNNPALKVAYPDDKNFENGIKEKDYSGAELADGYGLLLGTTPGQVTVTIVDKNTGKVVQTIQITNKISFKKSSKVTINDTDSLVTEKRVNDGEPVDSISRVYEGDVICLTLSGSGKVTATNGTVEKEYSQNIYMITAKAAETITITVVEN